MTGNSSSACKNKEFSHEIIDHDRGEDFAAECVGGQNAETSDELPHEHGAQKGTDTGYRVEKQYLNKPVVFPSLEHPENIGDIGNHVGHQKREDVANHRVARPAGFVDRFDLHIEKFHEMVFFLKGWKNLPDYEVKEHDVGDGGQAPSKCVFDKLNEWCGVKNHGAGNSFRSILNLGKQA